MPSENDDKPATRGFVEAKLKTVETALAGDIDSVRTELKADFQKLAREFLQAEARTDKRFEALQADMSNGFNRVMAAIDSFLGRLETYARESVTIPRTLDSHGETLRDHDGRLTSLESKR